MLRTAERKVEDLGNKENDFLYPDMVPLKVVVRLNPLELGIFFKKDKNSKKKKLYLVELKNLLLLENSNNITDIIYKQHSRIFNKKKIPYLQIYNIINKMLEYIKNELLENQIEIDEEEKNISENNLNNDFNNEIKNTSEDEYIETDEDIQNQQFIEQLESDKKNWNNVSF